MNKDVALYFFAGAQQYMEQLLADVPDERWADQPSGIRNHPAWTVGHLCCGHYHAMMHLGQDSGMDTAWLDIMNMGTMPTNNRSDYPSQYALWQQFRDGHEKITAAVSATSASDWEKENPIEGFRSFFPTVGHGLAYFLMSHEQGHYGQLQVWKRAGGLVKD